MFLGQEQAHVLSSVTGRSASRLSIELTQPNILLIDPTSMSLKPAKSPLAVSGLPAIAY